MNRRHRWFIATTTFLLLNITVFSASAQEVCEELVRNVFEELEDNCSTTTDGTACYGADNIEASFFVEDVNFSSPSDFVGIPELQTLRSSEFNAEEEEWGIGYFRADVEETTDPLVVLAVGAVIVENDQEGLTDEETLQAINFTTGGPSTCRDAPNTVMLQNERGASIDLVINGTRTRLASTIVLGTIDESPGSAGPQDDTMWIAVIDGSIILNPESTDTVTIDEGEVLELPLTDDQGLAPSDDRFVNEPRVPVTDPISGEPVIGPDGDPFYRQVPYEIQADPEPITYDGEGITDWENYLFVELIPPSLLNYPIDIPEPPAEAAAPVRPVEAAQPVETVETPEVVECSATYNWCFAGEQWGDGRCNDEDPAVRDWYWNAGWYRAQLACGNISGVPEQYAEAPTVSSGLPTTGCTQFDGSAVTYADFMGGNFLSNPLLYGDSACISPFSPSGLDIAYAPGGLADAIQICQDNGLTTSIGQTHPSVPVYVCS